MGYCGAPTILYFQETGQFIKMSSAALRESHPHDIHITKEALTTVLKINKLIIIIMEKEGSI